MQDARRLGRGGVVEEAGLDGLDQRVRIDSDWSCLSVQCHVVGTAVAAGGQLLALQQHVVEQARGAEAEQVRLQPLLPHRLGDGDQVLDRVLRGADAAGRLHADPLAGQAVPVAHDLEHEQGDGQRRRRRDLAGRGLDEVAAGQDREPGCAAHVVVGVELARSRGSP